MPEKMLQGENFACNFKELKCFTFLSPSGPLHLWHLWPHQSISAAG